jgi:hypothetical protein
MYTRARRALLQDRMDALTLNVRYERMNAPAGIYLGVSSNANYDEFVYLS